jgi:hypothetical protein
MHSPALHKLLIDARIEDLHRARRTSIQWDRVREGREVRTTRPSAWFTRATSSGQS